MFQTTIFLSSLCKYYQIFYKHLFWIAFSDILSKFVTVVYSLCFKKKTLEPLMNSPFKVELPTNNLQNIYFFS